MNHRTWMELHDPPMKGEDRPRSWPLLVTLRELHQNGWTPKMIRRAFKQGRLKLGVR